MHIYIYVYIYLCRSICFWASQIFLPAQPSAKHGPSGQSFTGRSCLHGEYDTDRPSKKKNTPQAKQQKDVFEAHFFKDYVRFFFFGGGVCIP